MSRVYEDSYESMEKLEDRDEVIAMICRCATNYSASSWQDYCPNSVIEKHKLTNKDFTRVVVESNLGIYKWLPTENPTYWSGCNYWENTGKNEFEPEGTFTSMHECEGCRKFESCDLKKDTPVWSN
jgi:hypothetical protein